MKFRTDFVTNSSSSSFILAKKPEFNEEQKAALVEYVEKHLLGKAILTPDSTEEEIEKVLEDKLYYKSEQTKEEVREALRGGKSIYYGYVSFEDDCAAYGYAEIFENIWATLQDKGEKDFTVIDGDLSY